MSEPTPEMIAAGKAVIERLIDRVIPEQLIAEAYTVMNDLAPPVWTDIWDTDYDRFYYRRSDGATVRWTKTPTGKKPWQGSRWHRGEWKLNNSSFNSGTAVVAMDAIDRHWPKAMREAKESI